MQCFVNSSLDRKGIRDDYKTVDMVLNVTWKVIQPSIPPFN